MMKFYKIVFLSAALILSSVNSFAQNNPSPLDSTRWGVVYDVPTTKEVKLKANVPYLKDARGTLAIDVYSPPNIKAGERLPAVVFLNAIGERPGGKVKDWEIYKTYPRLIAAHGMIGISMETDGERIQESLRALFDFLAKDGDKHGVDASRLGVYAASANVTQSAIFLMNENAPKAIRAAAFFYGGTPAPETALRRDLPVLFILAEGDMPNFGQQAAGLWQRVTQSGAPWTLMFAAGRLHAFDAFEDTDDSRRIIQQAIAFWKSHLEPVPQPDWKPSAARAVVASTYGSDFQKTADLLVKYLAENPNDVQGLSQYGRALNSLKKYDEAAAAFEKALKLAPNHPLPLVGLGQIRYAQTRYEEAAQLLGKGTEGGFRSSLIYGQLAFAQLMLNRNEEAIKSYERAFEMGIPPGANTRGLAYYNMASGYVRLKQTDKAFEVLSKAVDEGFNNRATFETDTDLAPIRADLRFQKILERLPKTVN